MLKNTADRLVAAANIRALESWLALQVLEARIPLTRAASATVAEVPEGHRPTVVVILWLAPQAWIGLGAFHVWAWWRLRDKLGFTRSGYRVRIWVT